MVDKAPQLDLVFRALADPTRRAMLQQLRSGEHSIVDLARPFDMTLAGAAKHVQVLIRAGLIERRKEGRTHYCRLKHQALRDAFCWLEQYSEFWSQRLDQLEELLKTDRQRKGKKP